MKTALIILATLAIGFPIQAETIKLQKELISDVINLCRPSSHLNEIKMDPQDSQIDCVIALNQLEADTRQALLDDEYLAWYEQTRDELVAKGILKENDSLLGRYEYDYEIDDQDRPTFE